MTDFMKRLLDLLDDKHVSKTDFLTAVKIGKGSLSNWTKRGTVPGGETLQKIANYFGVTTDYLLNGSEKNTENSNEESDNLEEEIQFRGGNILDKGSVAQLKAILDSTIDTYIKEKKKENDRKSSHF